MPTPARHSPLLSAYASSPLIEAGCDEAGRGCLAGPVFAAAVIWPKGLAHPTLNDSKQLSKAQREDLRGEVLRHALHWAIGEASPQEIDSLNIAKAAYLAMHRAIAQLAQSPELLLVDGQRFTPYLGIPHVCIVKGDGLYLSIAAASILAKTARDARMAELHEAFPHYGWAQNMGYPTAQHRAALRQHGPSPWHRRSFSWR